MATLRVWGRSTRATQPKFTRDLSTSRVSFGVNVPICGVAEFRLCHSCAGGSGRVCAARNNIVIEINIVHIFLVVSIVSDCKKTLHKQPTVFLFHDL